MLSKTQEEILSLSYRFEHTETCKQCPLSHFRCEIDNDGYPSLEEGCIALDTMVDSIESLRFIESVYMCPGICDVCNNYSPDCSYIIAGLHTPH